MKILHALRLTLRSAATPLGTAVLVVALLAGCATTRQVQSIVAESNAALLAAQLPGVDFGGDPSSAGKLPDPAAVSRKIDDFIAAHPDQKVAASALRVRQAILLIVHGQYELAQAAFDDATDLKTDRDKALKALSQPIIWWWKHAAENRWREDQRSEATQRLAEFDKVIPKLEGSHDIRDQLAEMRARMALHLANDLQIAQGKRAALVDALNRYGAIFTTNDVAVIKKGNLTPQAQAITTEEKRRLRAPAVIERAKQPALTLRDAGQPVKPGELNPDPAVRALGELVLSP